MKCPAKEELERIIEKGVHSIDIADLIKANEYGCIDCLGFGYKKDMSECDYYKQEDMNRKLLKGLG